MRQKSPLCILTTGTVWPSSQNWEQHHSLALPPPPAAMQGTQERQLAVAPQLAMCFCDTLETYYWKRLWTQEAKLQGVPSQAVILRDPVYPLHRHWRSLSPAFPSITPCPRMQVSQEASTPNEAPQTAAPGEHLNPSHCTGSLHSHPATKPQL